MELSMSYQEKRIWKVFASLYYTLMMACNLAPHHVLKCSKNDRSILQGIALLPMTYPSMTNQLVWIITFAVKGIERLNKHGTKG
jgi:hypothetical protein